jgi:adenylylsulfate kinase-like enzyme
VRGRKARKRNRSSRRAARRIRIVTVLLFGPTATGKSALALALADALGRRDRHRGLRAGLSRHGRRHREAGRRDARRAFRTIWST